MCYNVLFLTILQVVLSIHEPLVHLPNGWIRGRQDSTITNHTFYAFEKIPFAAPPIGDLRFKAPQPPKKWDGVLDTTRLDVICYQLSREGPELEDCLYLNVFTPQLPKNGSGDLLPVMFYIHGGGFYDGTARNLGPDRFIDNGVIYVVSNYRLGPFGFLSTGDDAIPGNNGLKDNLLALEWVHNNIALFGGDPQRVTIFGHSAGGAAVAFLQLNPKSEGWFSGVICQSGTHLGSWALQRDPKRVAFEYGGVLNETFRTNRNSVDLLKYLQSLPAQVLDKAYNKFYFDHLFSETPEYSAHAQGSFFGPVIENERDTAFFSDKPYKLVRDGRFVKVPLMIGITSEECIEHYANPNKTKRELELYDQNIEWLVPVDMEVADKINRIKIGHSLRQLYTNGEDFAQHLGAGIRYCSDNMLNKPMMKHAEFNSLFAKTYFYVFSYDGEVGSIDIHLDGAGTVGHGEENRYLICSGEKCDLSGFPETDRITQERLIKLWTNFAKYQNPTPESSDLLQNIKWPQLSVSDGDFYYLDIGENLDVKNHPVDTYSKWNELYASLGHDDFSTY